jgi:glucans biosynthesis protein
LTNPSRIQVSAFVDQDPVGFGLMQRERKFAAYEDLEARQERRPSVWVTPKGKWGAGHVELIELPTRSEYADNIVAFWRPREPLAAGRAHRFDYALDWTLEDPQGGPWLRVARTLAAPGNTEGMVRFLVDFEKTGSHAFDIETRGYQPGFTEPGNPSWRAIFADSSGSGRGVGAPFVQANPHIDGVRAFFDVDFKEQTQMDLRLSLRAALQPISEVWLYRWTK